MQIQNVSCYYSSSNKLYSKQKNNNKFSCPAFKGEPAIDAIQRRLTQAHVASRLNQYVNADMSATNRRVVAGMALMLNNMINCMKKIPPQDVQKLVPEIQSYTKMIKSYPIFDALKNGPTVSDCVINDEQFITDSSRVIRSAILNIPPDNESESIKKALCLMDSVSVQLPEFTPDEQKTLEYFDYMAIKNTYNHLRENYDKDTIIKLNDAISEYQIFEDEMVEKLKLLPTWNPIVVNRVNKDAIMFNTMIQTLYARLKELENSVDGVDKKLDKEINTLKISIVSLYNGMFAINQKLDNEIAANQCAQEKLNALIQQAIEYCDRRMNWIQGCVNSVDARLEYSNKIANYRWGTTFHW